MTPTRRLLSYFARYKRPLLLGFLCVLGSAVFSLLKPLIVGGAVNELSHVVQRGTLVRYGLMLVAASAIEGAFLFAQRRIIIGASRDIEYDMRNDFYGHLQRLPLRYYQGQRTGDLMSRATNDLGSVRMLIGPAVMHSVSSLLVVTGAFVMMLRIERFMALLALISVPVVAGLVKFFGQRIHVKFKDVQDQFGDISARVQENLAGVRVVRAFTQEEHELETFKRMNREYVERNRGLIRLTATFYPALHALIGVMFVVIFYMGSRRIVAGTMSIGDFVAFNFYLGRMVWPLIALGWVINLFQRGMASMKRLHEVWSVAPDADPVTELDVKAAGDIEIRGLTFSYGNRPVL
ncbi:MAG TPA: ABC transporter transmembrane domain-containing protein, partial [Thermoanaerobaculia bacterium]